MLHRPVLIPYVFQASIDAFRRKQVPLSCDCLGGAGDLSRSTVAVRSTELGVSVWSLEGRG